MFRSIKKKSIITAFLLLCPSVVFPSDQPPHVLKAAPDYKSITVRIVKKISLPRWYHEGLFYDGKNIWVANGRRGKIWVVDVSSGAVLSELAPISDFTEAITKIADNEYFITDWKEKRLYRARIDDDRIIAESGQSVAPAHPAGAVWAGRRLFVITWTRGFGTKFNLLEMDRDAKLIRKIRIARIEEPAHAAWDGKNLWITSWYNSRVYKIDPDRMEVTGSFVSPVSLATGIVWDGKYMWLTGTYGDLYQLEIL